MNSLSQLDELNLDAAAKTQVTALIQALLDQAKKETAADIQAKDLKIQALILELAHLRRLRYGVKNEALSSLQSDLFQETCNEDIAALEAEVEQADEPSIPPLPNPSAFVRVANPCQRICHALTIATNRRPANAVSAVRTWSKLAKTSPNNWMSNPPSSLFTAISGLNTLAVTVKPSPPRRFRPPSLMAAWRRSAC